MNIFTPSEVAPILRLFLKHPREAWRDQENVRRQWRALRYTEEPDFARACDEYDAFAGILGRFVPDVRFLPAADGTGLDSIYVRDAALIAPQGLVLGRMGKALRAGEPGAVRPFLGQAGWPVAGEIWEPGTIEGGDFVWLDARTAAIGHGYRTNGEGIRQFRELVAVDGCEVVEVPLPHWDGPGDVLHLMSMLSPVDERKLLVYSRLLPVPFRKRLLDMGFELDGFERPRAGPGPVPGDRRESPDGRGPGKGRDRGPDLRGNGYLRQGLRRPDLPDPPVPALKLTYRARDPILGG